MSSIEEPSWESLPPHLRTSKLAFAICPHGAEAAEHDLEKVLFWGRFAFHGFSREQLGAYLWRKFGEQLSTMPDAALLSWLKKMEFRDHAAFDGMSDDDVVRYIRESANELDDYAARYAGSDDFPSACDQMDIQPSTDVRERIMQARRIFHEDPVLASLLPNLLEKKRNNSIRR